MSRWAKRTDSPLTPGPLATWDVAQVANLLYRRLPVGKASQVRARRLHSTFRRLAARDTADWQSALRFQHPRRQDRRSRKRRRQLTRPTTSSTALPPTAALSFLRGERETTEDCASTANRHLRALGWWQDHALPAVAGGASERDPRHHLHDSL